jgi:hypothetical protein
MRLFLATHIQWLWSLLHTFNHPYSPQTLLLFVLVGLLQIIVAVGGGALTVEALNTETRRKRCLSAGFWVLGLMLFAATVWTGLLNDQSEKASDGRADDLKTALTELSNSVVTAAQLHAEITKLPARAPSTPAQEKLDSQFQQAIDQTRELARRYSTLPSVTATPVSQPPIPAPSTQPPPLGAIAQPQSFHPVPTRASVQADIEKTLNQIADIDRNADSSVQGTLSSVRGLYVSNYSGNQALKDAAFRSTVPVLLGVFKERDNAFQHLMPEIIQERSQGLQLLGISPSEVAADKTAFDNAVAKSNEKVPIPDSWPQAGGLYSLRYTDMHDYLSRLDERLKARP